MRRAECVRAFKTYVRAQDTAPVNLDMLQELCTALTAAALDDDEAALSAADFLKVKTFAAV